MSCQLVLKNYFLLLCYLYFFLVPQIWKIEPIKTDITSTKQFFVEMGDIRSDIFLDPKPGQLWEQGKAKVWQTNRTFMRFSTTEKFTEPLKTYSDNNLELDFNFPPICYKFPLSEHTKEG